MPTEFRILGPLEVRQDGQPLPLSGAKERALLAILLLAANEPVTADRLVDQLWGEAPPATARKSLQVRVATLRRQLPDGVLVTRGGSYVLELKTEQLDLHRFERLVSEATDALANGVAHEAATMLREALALWRGPALSDFGYESFAGPAIARLEELRVEALELRIEADLEAGRHNALIGELTELIATHPLRERLRGQLMLALYRDGRQAEALELYQGTRQILNEELGIEPGPALQELQRAMLRQEPALAPAKRFETERSVLVAPQNRRHMDGLLQLAESLARKPARELIIARLVPQGSDISDEAARLSRYREKLLGGGLPVRTAVFTADASGDDLVRLVVEQDVDLLLLDGAPDLGESVIQSVLSRAPCDVAIHVARDRPSAAGPIFVLFGGGAHDWAAIEVAAWIAGAQDATLKVAGPAEGPERDASRTLASASLAVQRVLGIPAEPLLVAPKDETVLAAVAEAEIVVIGLPERWKDDGLGRVRRVVAERAHPPVVLVRSGLRPGGLAPRESLTRFTWTLGPGP